MLAQHTQQIVALIEQALAGIGAAGAPVLLERPKVEAHGDLACNVAMQAARGLKKNPREVATAIAVVTREFYYNDAGVQIETLARSVQLRARQLRGETIDEEQVGYRGDYILDIAREFLDRAIQTARDGAPVQASGVVEDLDNIRRFSVAYLRHEQDTDLTAFGVRFDHFFLESSLYADGKVEAAVQAMSTSGMTYEAEGALWLRTTEMGDGGPAGQKMVDDKDRVMRKSDGTYTYFVPDVAYHVVKFQRGFAKVINVQGADHHGTVARVRAGVQAAARSLGVAVPRGFPDYLLHKMVRVMKGGEEVKMSKRAGSYVTLRDLLEWAGRDATRFFLASRKADTEFTFDVDLAQSRSDENPVYYVQYAHARICSVLAQAAERGWALDEAGALAVDLSPLTAPRELALLQRLASWPDVVKTAADELAPHQIAFALKEVGADFHAFYNAERVLVDEAPVRNARLALLLATRQVLRNGLALLGVSAPERM